jgi:hypothetical protein
MFEQADPGVKGKIHGANGRRLGASRDRATLRRHWQVPATQTAGGAHRIGTLWQTPPVHESIVHGSESSQSAAVTHVGHASGALDASAVKRTPEKNFTRPPNSRQ